MEIADTDPTQADPDLEPDPEQVEEDESPGAARARAEALERHRELWPDDELDRAVAALLFASPEPLSFGRLAALLDKAPRVRLRESLERLRERMTAAGLPFEPLAIAGGWQFMTGPRDAEVIARLAVARKEERVSPAALETLAIVAYRQPVTKAEIEAIRGVQAGPMLRSLVDRGLVRVAGRADQPGSPLLYGTTRKFLDVFGLAQIQDLPRDAELVRD